MQNGSFMVIEICTYLTNISLSPSFHHECISEVAGGYSMTFLVSECGPVSIDSASHQFAATYRTKRFCYPFAFFTLFYCAMT